MTTQKDIRRINKLEKKFSRHRYNGSGKKGFAIKTGSIPVMISAPHSVNHSRNGELKVADKWTGAIALYLHEITGCHIIYATNKMQSDPNYDEYDSNLYQKTLLDYVNTHHIPVLIDLHGAEVSRPYAVELGTAPKKNEQGDIEGNPYVSLKGHEFICRLIRLSFEYVFSLLKTDSCKDICENTYFGAGVQNTITKSISSRSETACIQLEINGNYRYPAQSENLHALLEGLKIIIALLSKVHWNTKYNNVLKLRQSNIHKPQDKVCLFFSEDNTYEGDIIEINSFVGNTEHVYIHKHENNDGTIYFTNRLIHNIFNQEWSSCKKTDSSPFLQDAPILVSGRDESALPFPIGMPKSYKLDRVYLSSKLYERLVPLSHNHSFVVYNRLTDSRLFFVFDKETDYGDNGNVSPQEKVMLPRYFRQLLGYNTYPFDLIRKEEFEHIPAIIEQRIKKRVDDIVLHRQNSLPIHTEPTDTLFGINSADVSKEQIQSLVDNACERLKGCYELLIGEVFYRIKADCGSADLSFVSELFKALGFYDKVELLILPYKKSTRSALSLIKHLWARFENWVLGFIIGKSEYLLKTCWTNETDDKNHVARLSPNMMSLLGVSDNDKVVIRFGDKHVTTRILANPNLSDYQVGIPANERKMLDMYSVNDVVVVSRDMRHTFQRNSQAQTIAILGTVLAVFQVIKQVWIGAVVCIVFIPLIIYFALNEERIKVK